MGRGGIPDRWLDYSKLGSPMRSTEGKAGFLAFKVPLKQQLTSSLDQAEVFTPSDLLSLCSERGFQLGLIIDLTFTKRYYQPFEFTDAGVEYVKIPIEGQIVPKKARMDKFANTVKKFLKDPKNQDAVIGVHCTHGVNRTGYAICKYLIEHEAMVASEAIDMFRESRGHELERDTYLEHLKTGKLPEGEKRSYYVAEYDAAPSQSHSQSHYQGGQMYDHYGSNRYNNDWGGSASYSDQHYSTGYEDYYNTRHHHNDPYRGYSRAYDGYGEAYGATAYNDRPHSYYESHDRYGTRAGYASHSQYHSFEEPASTSQNKNGPPSDRNDTSSDRYGTSSDRYGTSSDRYGTSSDRYDTSSVDRSHRRPHKRTIEHTEAPAGVSDGGTGADECSLPAKRTKQAKKAKNRKAVNP